MANSFENPNNKPEFPLDLDEAVEQLDAIQEAKMKANLDEMIKTTKDATSSEELTFDMEGKNIESSKEKLSFDDAMKATGGTLFGIKELERIYDERILHPNSVNNYEDFKKDFYWAREEGLSDNPNETAKEAMAFNMETGSSGLRLKTLPAYFIRATPEIPKTKK